MERKLIINYIEAALKQMDGMQITYNDKASHILTQIETIVLFDNPVEWTDIKEDNEIERVS